jgi:hypothetical protein
MGEYFVYRGNPICKIGTCEHIMYAKRDEVKVLATIDESEMCQGALDYTGSFYRFPWPDEDNEYVSPLVLAETINERKPFTTVMLHIDRDLIRDVVCHKSMVIGTKPRGCNGGYHTNISMPCPLSSEWDNIKEHVAASSNGFYPFVSIVGEGYDAEGVPRTIFECGYCGVWFSTGTEEINAIKNCPSNKDVIEKIGGRLHANPICNIKTI